MSFELPFDKIQAAIQENLDIEVDEAARTIKLEFKGNIYEEIPFQDMLEDEEGLKRMSKNLLDEEINYTSEPLPDGKGALLHFETEEDFKKMREFINGIVYGDLLKDLMEKIMKSMFAAFDDRSEFDNTT
jgi:hypothetical protein